MSERLWQIEEWVKGRARSMVWLVAVAAVSALALQPAAAARAEPPPGGWLAAGHDPQNTRSAGPERGPDPGVVTRLRPLWTLTAAGPISATPTADSGDVYVPDWGGKLWAIRGATGAVRWSHAISDYTGFARDLSRTSPAISGDELVLGVNTFTRGSFLVAVDRQTGQRRWLTQVDSHPAAVATGSPVVVAGTVYVGVSSEEEALAAQPGYVCCSFRGSVVALDARTGQVRWKTSTVPTGYSGGGVWGSTPAIDPETGLVYVGTGNNYSVPPGVCTSPNEQGCTAPAADDHVDSVLALDLRTGAVRWALNTLSADVNTQHCIKAPQGCGPDFDFGSGPNLITLATGRRLLGIGQKSGIYWALDPRTGRVVWQTQVGPGGAFGGIQWGSATDGRRVYAAIADTYAIPYTITSAGGVTQTIRGGSWAALDARTGRILWQTADPQGAMDMGFVSTAEGVVYAGSTAATGNDMYALDAATGAIRWAFGSGGSVVSGAAIAHRVVFWGSGYFFASACPGARFTVELCPAPAGLNDKLFAFAPAAR